MSIFANFTQKIGSPYTVTLNSCRMVLWSCPRYILPRSGIFSYQFKLCKNVKCPHGKPLWFDTKYRYCWGLANNTRIGIPEAQLRILLYFKKMLMISSFVERNWMFFNPFFATCFTGEEKQYLPICIYTDLHDKDTSILS